MKKLIIILGLLPVIGFAQNNEGQIIFEETVDLDIDSRVKRWEKRMGSMEGSEAMIERMKAMQKSDKIFYFTGKETLYKTYEDPNEPKGGAGSGGHMRMMMMSMKGESDVYQNLEESRATNQKDFGGKMFLIKSDMKEVKWKLTGESDSVAGYVCHKATTMMDTLLVEAWFTPQIPVSAGPLGFGKLPGMILKLEVEKKYSVMAKTITFEKVEEGVIVPLTKGKEVTQEEFLEIRTKWIKDKKEMYGGGGGRMEFKH